MVESLCGVHASLIEQAIHLLNRVNLLGGKASAVKAYGVHAAISDRLTGGNDKRRDVFVDLRTALYHHMIADVRELVNERTTSDDGEIFHLHFTRQLGGVGHDDVIMQDTIVRHMTVRHDEVVVSDDGFSLGGCSAMDGDELPEYAVVADNGEGLLAAVFEILRYGADDGGGEDMTVVTEDDVVVDVCEGVDGDVLAELSFWAHVC